MTLKKQIVSVLATGAVLLNSTLPVFAGTTLVISGNGADSNNESKVEIKNEQTVVQSNNADVKNNIDVKADSGNNEASKNTGGDVKIDTGDASSEVKVENNLNSNQAELDCCVAGDVDVLISGNGADSKNEADLEIKNETLVAQENEADVKNYVDSDAKTGDNEASKNTGGDVEVKTGDASSKVKVQTTANANSARVGGGNGDDAGSISLKILGNGADSRNELDLEFRNEVALVQSNEADVKNDVDAKAETGDNEANENTGGEVLIDTGDASVDVRLDNMVNFNWADVDCGCLFDLLAKIADNGYDTKNEIKAEVKDELEVFQDNCGEDEKAEWALDWYRGDDCELENEVDADAASGDNDAKTNTDGGHGGDPAIYTGDSSAEVRVENAGNSNVFGDAPDTDWPDHLGGFNLNITIDLEALLAALGL